MNYQRERDGMDFSDYVYSVDLHRWVYRPLGLTRPDEERAEAVADERAERKAEQQRLADEDSRTGRSFNPES